MAPSSIPPAGLLLAGLPFTERVTHNLSHAMELNLSHDIVNEIVSSTQGGADVHAVLNYKPVCLSTFCLRPDS